MRIYTGNLSNLQKSIKEMFDISNDFEEASNHAYTCRCKKCWQWWKDMGPEYDEADNPHYGPFTKEEIESSKYDFTWSPFHEDNMGQ